MALEQLLQDLTTALKENTAALVSAGKTSAGRATKKTEAAPPASAPAPAAASQAVTEPATASAPKEAAATAPASGTVTAVKDPTIDDIRNALVKAQTRLGSKDKVQALLTKFTPGGPHTTGTVKKEDYAKLIAECETLK